MAHQGLRLARLASCGIFFPVALVLLDLVPAGADTWVCPGPHQTELYTDYEGPGCRPLEGEGSVQIYRGLTQSPMTAAPLANPSISSMPTAPGPGEPASRSSHPFPEARLQVPVLLIPSSMKGQVGYVPNPWDSALVNLDVSHIPTGEGPDISSDHHFKGTSIASFETAALAAAKAVGYDPQYLRARLHVPRAPVLDRIAGFSLDGPSAGITWAVAVASAILGDPFRPDVCLSGTINLRLEVGPVGGLEDKIKACRHIKSRQLIFPVGQGSNNMTLQGKSYEITLTEVRTLAEAYEAATGQLLRPASLR
jgi:Lon protease (S16) C-terminal proteolytic domain